MHVLVIPSWYPTREDPQRGVYFIEQLQALRRQGVRLGVIYPEHRSLRGLSPSALRRHHFQDTVRREQGIPTLRRHGWNLFSRLPLGLRWCIRQAQTLARRYIDRFGRPDLIHAHSAQWAAVAAARLHHALKLPYVVTEHFSGFQRRALPTWQLRWARRGLFHARRVAAVSPFLKDLLVDRGLVPPERTCVLPNAVDTGYFIPTRQRRLSQTYDPESVLADTASGTAFRFLSLGHLAGHKGHDVLLRAFAAAFRDAPGVRLEIGGSGPERARLERWAGRLGIGRQVLFLGQLDRPAVRRALWRAHAFVLPSRHETFGVVLLEAMATGLPVVATRCGGPEHLVTPETGLLVPPGDAGTLARTLREMVMQRSFYYSDVIRNYIKNHFGASTVARRTVHFYQQALGA